MKALADLEARLLDPSLLRSRWLRRNVMQYEVVTYVHHALVLARTDQTDAARVFAKRAQAWLYAHEAVDLGKYRGAVEELCALLLDS